MLALQFTGASLDKQEKVSHHVNGATARDPNVWSCKLNISQILYNLLSFKLNLFFCWASFDFFLYSYCECFAAGVYCIGPCSCVDCFNKPIHEDTVMATRKQIESRNPLAFAPKVIGNSDSIMEVGDDAKSKTPASARHKRGCNCKKSNCLKKYCECYQVSFFSHH